jgi:hypothetical protein
MPGVLVTQLGQVRKSFNMTSINAAATSFRAEATNAIANLNFEVNLFTKRIISPPAEYAGVGEHLAPSRLKEAQDGVRHTIARKLGILFKSILPSTPELIRAYGSRASEISQSSTANPRGDKSHGAFASTIGADATTLWAAATSGKPAIQCHLLACFLARIWEPSEATSIWVEVVSRRKVELEAKLAEEGELEQEVLLAAGQEFPRSDLRDWDASARAWLRVADSVMAKQQTQLRLILDNLHLPVNVIPQTYESVIDAWTSAMSQMEKLLGGIPLQVHRGDILLGLLSWHLYPDMKHLSAQERYIYQYDSLLEGRGILTLGLEPSPRLAKDPKSVYWALPLAHLRYYGRLPVTSTRSVRTTDQDRITINEMLWAMLSAYILLWDDGSVPTREVLQFVIHVASELHYALFETKTRSDDASSTMEASTGDRTAWAAASTSPSKHSWLIMLSRIALKYKDSLDQDRVRKIRNMGRKFCRMLSDPFQGIFSVSTYLKAAYSLEDKIRLLREIAATLTSQSPTTVDYEYIITYRYFYLDSTKSDVVKDGFEYATASPEFGITEAGIDRSHSARRYRRWLAFRLEEVDNAGLVALHTRLESIKEIGEEAGYPKSPFPTFERRTTRGNLRNEGRRNASERVMIVQDSTGSERTNAHNVQAKYITMQISSNTNVFYEVLYGDTQSIALLRQHANQPVLHQRGQQEVNDSPTYKIEFKKIMQLFNPASVDFTRCSEELRLDGSTNASLLGMTFVDSLYNSMSGATIDVRAVQFDFRKALWLDSVVKSSTTMDRRSLHVQDTFRQIASIGITDGDTGTSFACIAMMETGKYNLNPSELQSVFALCSADSLYIASALLRDPSQQPCFPGIQRFTGNIGKAGMAFMVPPKVPEIKSYDQIDEWYQYDHKEFDGNLDNCFEGTSLHLSFSEAWRAVNVEFSGDRDIDAYFLETLISVYDRDTWIAELDILGALRSDHVMAKFLACKDCNCSPALSSETRLTSIDNFAEMIVPPSRPGIVRARGNWQARLAAVSLCVAKGYQVILKPEQTCWTCLSKTSLDDTSVQLVIRRYDRVVMIL